MGSTSDLIYHGGQWLLDFQLALTISGSRWHNFILLRRYPEAVAEVGRLLGEPRPPRADRSDSTGAEIKLQVARLALGRDGEPALRLHELLVSGTQPRRRMALLIRGNLGQWLATVEEAEQPADPELVTLVLDIVRIIARRRKPSTEPMVTLSDLERHLESSARFG